MLSKFIENGVELSAKKKQQYIAPKLVRYGQVRDLTQSGSQGNNEGDQSAPPASCQSGSTSKKPCVSDLNAKEKIINIGSHPLGIGIYLFDYKPEFRDRWGHSRQFGVIAQEVETVMPEAVVVHPDGYKMVDYEMLGVDRNTH